MKYYNTFDSLQGKAREKAIEDVLKIYGKVLAPTDEQIQDTCDNWQIVFNPDGEIQGEYRVCSICGEKFVEGYYAGETNGKYYCSDECLHKDFTDDEWRDLYTEDGENYYTSWV